MRLRGRQLSLSVCPSNLVSGLGLVRRSPHSVEYQWLTVVHGGRSLPRDGRGYRATVIREVRLRVPARVRVSFPTTFPVLHLKLSYFTKVLRRVQEGFVGRGESAWLVRLVQWTRSTVGVEGRVHSGRPRGRKGFRGPEAQESRPLCPLKSQGPSGSFHVGAGVVCVVVVPRSGPSDRRSPWCETSSLEGGPS